MALNEPQLAGLAYAIIGDSLSLTADELALVEASNDPDTKAVRSVTKAIRAGGDPLGDMFCALRSPKERRGSGATYTPPAIVASMIAWATRQDVAPSRVVDPGSGSGRFLVAAARAFPKARLIAVENDPLARLLLRANARASGFSKRLVVDERDYRLFKLPRVKGATLFIGNPPYVRHHQIGDDWKQWFADTATKHGFRASKLAGLHIHFFLKTRAIGRPGDFGAFITSAEWIDVNYGSVLRDMLADGLGGASLHVINPDAKPFADAMTTGAITCFRLGGRGKDLLVRAVEGLEELDDLGAGAPVPWASLQKASRWSHFVRQTPLPRPGDIELGEIFRVHRGQVTGANGVWIAGPHAQGLPARFLFPTVTKARELIAAGLSLDRPDGLRSVIDLPVDLDQLSAKERKSVERFLDWARGQGVPLGFVARNRRAWWSVGLRQPAPILCTYMARRAPAFVRNRCNARHINIAHGLYPREPIGDDRLDQILAYLTGNVSIASGRTYAGGLTKFEPREVERVHIPSPDRWGEIVIR